MNGSLNAAEIIPSDNKLSVLSLVINNVCNLSCDYCYLSSISKDKQKTLSDSEWQIIIDSALDERVDYLCFSGKEVFAKRNSANVFFDALKRRNEKPDSETKIGCITNGTLLGKYREQLTECKPDWLDISIDGLPSHHNHLRSGSFNKVLQNLPWLLDLFGDNLWACITVTNDNIHQLGESIAFLSNELGISSFALGIYKPLSYTPEDLTVDTKGKLNLVQRLKDLSKLKLKKKVRVFMQADMGEDELVQQLRQAELANNESFLVKKTQFKNGLELLVEATDKPKDVNYSARITHEGLILSSQDVTDVSLYKKAAKSSIALQSYDVGNIRHLNKEMIITRCHLATGV